MQNNSDALLCKHHYKKDAAGFFNMENFSLLQLSYMKDAIYLRDSKTQDIHNSCINAMNLHMLKGFEYANIICSKYISHLFLLLCFNF